MSNKTAIKNTLQDSTFYLKRIYDTAQAKDYDTFDIYLPKFYEQMDKLIDLLGNKVSEFNAKLDALITPHGCSNDNIDNYYDNKNFVELHRCLDLNDRLSLEIIDEMF